MKSYIKNGPSVPNSPSFSSSDPVTPTLQDSKSASNLHQQLKKFRQTSYFPIASKNINKQFLRYTVNLRDNDQQTLSTNMVPNSSFVVYRKLNAADEQKKMTPEAESASFFSKANNSQKKSQKKSSNPERKQQGSIKQSPIPKFLEKKLSTDYNVAQVPNKTERIPTIYSKITTNAQIKTFTPKINKTLQQSNTSNKIMSSFSSSNLLKLNHVNSPTCQSETSRILEKQNFSKGPRIDDFMEIKRLGQGKFGQVFLVVHKQTNSIYAIKKIKKDSIIRNKMQEQFLMEIKMQFYLNHPNILKLYGVMKDEEHVYLILQFMEQGTLYSLLKKQKTFKQDQASQKLRDVLDGVAYLHNKMIAHRDIKPENIVISYVKKGIIQDVCKICDLGWAALCDNRRKTLCGTIDYASPELLQGKQYGIAIDLWCLGVLCYEIMVGKCPFYHISRKQTMRKIINTDLSDIKLPSNIPNETKDFIYKLLLKNPQQRMSAENALQHPLIVKYYDQELQDIQKAYKRKF